MQPEPATLDQPKGDRWCEVRVPLPWSAFFAADSDVPSDMIPNHMAWYRRTFAVPDIPVHSRLVVHFDAVNFFAVVFVNGARCGDHLGDAMPFDVDVTTAVTPGEKAELLVGVQDISFAEHTDAGPSGGRARRLMYPGLVQHAGIRGGVSLRVLPELHLTNVQVCTSLPPAGTRGAAAEGGRVHVGVRVRNDTGEPAGFSLTTEIYDGARQVVAFTPVRGVVAPGEETQYELGRACPTATLWWPDEPHLYQLRAALWSSVHSARDAAESVGEVVDRYHVPLGFREFRIENDQFLFNHVPIQIRSESFSPTSAEIFGEMRPGAAPKPIVPEQARQLLLARKYRRGINAIRFHRMPPVPTLLDAADRAGLLAIVEFPFPDDGGRYAVDAPQFWVNAEKLVRRWVAANAHHPSVVLWSLDQGMVRRYGTQVVEGLRSLARTIVDIDPTRPVEFGQDGDLVDARDLSVDSPVSVPLAPTGVSFRSAAPHEPESVAGRVLPLPDARSPWLPLPGNARPLTLLEHNRPVHTPASLAFFLGDEAYAAGADLTAASASLSMLEMAACRMSPVAGINTIGRPPAPQNSGDTASDVVALPVRLFANFYAGTRFVEELVLRNDTRFDQDFELSCHFTTAEGTVPSQTDEVYLPAGLQDRRNVAFQLPEIRDVVDADRASSELAELHVQFGGRRVGSYEHRRRVAIWPHVRSQTTRRIGLYDPDGRTAAALSAVGVSYVACAGEPGDDLDTIIIGEHAFDEDAAPDREAVCRFVEAGGLAVVLAQKAAPYDLTPVPLITDEQRDASIAFIRDADHHALQGLSTFEMRWWQNDHRVAHACFRKPSWGNFRCLVDVGGPGGLRWAAALEVFHGSGSLLFSQLDLVEKTARAPVAAVLLARLAGAVPSWRSVEARTIADGNTFSRIGVRCPTLETDRPVNRRAAGPAAAA
jgi:hypothetical protein